MLHFDKICDYGNETARVWQLKCECRQKSGPFWVEWRQADTNRGLGTWKLLGLAGIQGESGPVVRCMGLIQLRERSRERRVAWLELILCDWGNCQGYCRDPNSGMSHSVKIGKMSLVKTHTKQMLRWWESFWEIFNNSHAATQTYFL